METSHYIQLIIALLLGAGFLVAAFILHERKIFWFLLLLIPFQPVDSRYGTLNEVLVYFIGLVFLLKWRDKQFPLIGIVMGLFLIYLVSLILAPSYTYFGHTLYLIAIASNFILFYLVYNFILHEGSWEQIWKIIVVLNVLFLGYCTLQLAAGFTQLSVFGISELSFEANREEHQRLTGPFKATAMTAEYLVIQILILTYAITRETSNRRKLVWMGMAMANFAFIIATGNRGGVVSLVIGILAFFFLFRRELGFVRMAMISVFGVFLLLAVSVFIVKYTEFNSIYDRFTGTKFDGLVPDTRSVWVDIWPKIIESPIFGHGPRYRLEQTVGLVRAADRQIPYAHNLYMYIFYTIGATGLMAYLALFFAIGRRYYLATKVRVADTVLDGIPALGLIVLIVFLASEMRMEMLRFLLNDYQHYLFMILAAFLALSDIKRNRALGVTRLGDLQGRTVGPGRVRQGLLTANRTEV